jgi:hypothetical protein
LSLFNFNAESSSIVSNQDPGGSIFSLNRNYFIESFEDATAKAFGYLVIDLHPTSEDSHRLSTNIFDKELKSFYIPI